MEDTDKKVRPTRKASHKHNLYLMEVDNLPGVKVPLYARRCFVEITPKDGAERKVYVPLLGKHAIMKAMFEDADIFSFSYKPYVNYEWLIGYWLEEKKQDSVDSLMTLVENCLKLAELGALEKI